MVFNKRERLIGILAAIGLGLFLLDSYAVGPYLDRRTKIETDNAAMKKKLTEGNALINSQKRIAEEWRQLRLRGLQDNPSAAESLLLDSLQRWQLETNVRITAFHQDRPTVAKDKQFLEVPFHATGNGRLADVAAMLWVMETAPMPLRVNSVQVAPQSGREGTDNLTATFNLTALCINPNPEPDKAPVAPKPQQ